MSDKNTNIYLDAKTSFLEPVVNQYGGHMVMSNVKKSTRVKYLNIDTRFTEEYEYNKVYNQTNIFTISLPEKLCNVKSIRVVTTEIPITFYNFSSALGNNCFKISNTIGSTTTSSHIKIKDGYYTTALALVNELNKYSTSDLSYNFSYNTTTNSISFTPQTNSTIEFDTNIAGDFDKYNFRSKLGWSLGFRNQKYDIESLHALNPESQINLNTVRYIYLVVDEFSSGFTNSFVCPLNKFLLNKKILARIAIEPNILPYGLDYLGSIQISNTFNGFLSSDTRYYNGTVDIQKMNIQLVNEYGQPVYLNGLDFSFLLEVNYE